ncbi:MAG: response regulator, partial [Treponema sp.]|nr:response regulator [Treponema sp.]
MKQVLIINASLMFQEFLKEKLTAEGIQVEITEGKRDAFPKIVSILPDLAIINLDAITDFAELAEFFDKKKNDPNANRIPVIIAGPEVKREIVVPLREVGVLKYFTKPIKFDIFFESIGRSLKTGFAIDTTPAIIDVHINNNIIFIETAVGFNREKISLLKYKLKDLIDKNQLQKPRIVLMMTDMSLCYADGINMELLLDNILADKRVEKANLKILTLDPFIHDFI